MALTPSPDVINLTPHAVVVMPTGFPQVRLASAGVLRLASSSTVSGAPVEPHHMAHAGGAPLPTVYAQVFSGLDLPSTQLLRDQVRAGAGIIVSLPVAQCLLRVLPPEMDLRRGVRLYTPGTGPDSAVRDVSGQITGVKTLEYHGTVALPTA